MMDENAIAIIGINFRLPGADSLPGLWANLHGGKVSIRQFTADAAGHLIRPGYVFADAALPDIDMFAADFFSFSRREAGLLDPQQRILLECAWGLLETIGYGNPANRPTIGVYAGASMNTYLPNVIAAHCDLMSLAGTEIMLANDKDYLCGRISYKLGLTGPSVAIQTGCSSSLTSVHIAMQSLLCGECDIALAGGVSIQAGMAPGYLYEPNVMFSPDGMCRPFDRDATGTLFGDGVGLVALRPLRDAIAGGDSVLAIIRGSAINNEGSGRMGFTAPGVDGQTRLVAEALAQARVAADQIGLVEAHGTGTALGDAVEFAALNGAFRSATPRKRFCALGSIKANVGHLAAAAGIAGLAKVILALKHGIVPPHPTFSAANPALALDDSPFVINRHPIDWPLSGERRAGISSFGAGGSNVHLVVEQGPRRPTKRPGAGLRAIPLSASHPAALQAYAGAMAEQIATLPDIDLNDIALTLAQGRAAQACRIVCFAHNPAELMAMLNQASGRTNTPGACSRLVLIVGRELDLRAIATHPLFMRQLTALLAAVNPRQPRPIDPDHLLAQGRRERPPWDWAQGILSLAALLTWRTIIAIPLVMVMENDACRSQPGEMSLADIAHGLAAASSGSQRGAADNPGGTGQWTQRLWALIQDYLVLTLRGTPEISLIMTGGGENEETGFIQRQERILIPPQRGDFAAAMARRCQARGAMAISVAQTEATTAVLHCAGDLWRCGIAINWHALGPGPDARRIALPLPSLPRQRCWFQNEQTQPVANVVPAGGGQYRPVPPPTLCYRESWRRTGRCAPLGEDQRLGALVLIYQPGCRFARALGDLLKERHEQVARVMIGKSSAMRSGEHCLDWHDPLAASRLVERLTQQGRAPERLLLLFNDTVDYQAPAAGELFHTADIMLELARACSEHSRAPLTIDLIGPGFADVLGDEPVSPACAAALAAALSLTQEMPHIACYCIDVAAKPNAGRDEARAILAEIAGAGYAGGRPAISALRNGWRWQRRFTPWFAAVGAEPLVNLTCLVAGGLGNVGYRLARHLAIHYQARLVLLIHAPLRATPDHRHYAQRLRELQTHARQVEVIVGDVADVTRLSALLPGAEQRVGAAINCFIHAAGHSGGQTLHWVQKSTRGQWQGLMRPKFTGAVALHSVLGQRKLQFGCFISSLAVYAGGLGLAAYAAANAACAAFAQLHSRSHPYLTMDWDGWPGWNRQGSFKYAASRARPLEYHEIISAFEMALGSRSAGGRLAISTEPMDARLAPACAVTEPGPAAGADLSREEIGTALMDIWHNCLQCEIDQNANFFDLGGDSLIGAGLVRRINTRFGIGLTMVDLFEAAAIAPLADRICQALPSRQPCRPRQGGDDDE